MADGNTLYVSGLQWASENAERINPPFIISIFEENLRHLQFQRDQAQRHLKLLMDDAGDPDAEYADQIVVPNVSHVEAILEFGRTWAGRTDLLVHCRAGRNRSAATALILLGMFDPDRSKEFATQFRNAGPWLNPNKRLIEVADRFDIFHGRLKPMLNQMGPARMKGIQGAVEFDLPPAEQWKGL